MTYGDARRRSRTLFGETGEVRLTRYMSTENPPRDIGDYHQVGVMLKGVFVCLGIGDTWEKAFASVKSTEEQ